MPQSDVGSPNMSIPIRFGEGNRLGLLQRKVNAAGRTASTEA